MDNFMNLITAAVLAGTPLLLGMLGEILTEKAGNLNLGVEGMMYMGAVSGLAGAWYFEQASKGGAVAVAVCVVVSFLVGCLGALIYGFLTISLRANQNVTGLVLTIFGTGFGNFYGEVLGQKAGGYATVGDETKAVFASIDFGFLSDIPVLGKLLFNYNWMVYFAIIVAVVMAWFFNKTRAGLNLRAVGEDPATADAAGINVTKYKYLATVLGGGICGLAGMYMSMVTYNGIWVNGCISGYGWLAVALVIFATWNPIRGLICALVFGALSVLRLYYPVSGVAMQIYDMLPFAATIVVLIATSIRGSREHSQPKSCGLNYFREER